MHRGLLFLALILFPLSGYCFTGYQQKLRALIPYSTESGGRLGVYVRSLKDDGPVVFGHNESENFIPASNNKLISSYAALSLLGKYYRFKTEFYADGEVHKGSVRGGLYVKAYGDPSIKTEDLIEIIRSMKAIGIKRIKGNLYFDETYFDNVKYPAGWKTEWIGDYYSPPISAFNLNYNTVKVVVTPLRSGRRPEVKVYPEHYGLRVRNRAVTSRKTRDGELTVELKSDKVLKVSGDIDPRDGVKTIEVAVSEPRKYFGKVFTELLASEGIRFDGRISSRKVPRLSRLLYVHYSDPLYEIINEFNKDSVNIIGEALVKTLGAEFVRSPGTREDGASVIMEFIREQGIGNKMEIYDGSGLSVYNKVSPKVLVEILVLAYYDPGFSSEFLSSLPVAGVDGTLKKNFSNSLIRGRVIAKTGYLNEVRALSGYVYAENGNVLVFSVIYNGPGDEIKDFYEIFLVELLDCCS